VVLVCHWAFDILKLGSIQLMTLAGNRPSERVAEKAGFVRIGTVPDYSPERALPTFTPREATHWQLRG
jgi:RimJ/RimL family protein N-acetyltransferase